VKNRCQRSALTYLLGVMAFLFHYVCCNDLSFASPTVTSASQGQKLKVRENKDHVKNVFYFKKGKWHNLTGFDEPHQFFAYKVSPGNDYAFVWHTMKYPRVLSIYNLRTLELIKELEPGTDGHLQWNMDNNILHTYGCGSGCMEAKLYSVKGETLFSVGGSPVEVSPSGRFLAHFTTNWVGAQNFQLYDLSHKHLVRSKLPLLTINSVGHVNLIRWGSERTIAVKYTDAEDAEMKENPKPEHNPVVSATGDKDTPEVITREILSTEGSDKNTKYFEKEIIIDIRKYTSPKTLKPE